MVKLRQPKSDEDRFHMYKYLIVIGSLVAYFVCDGVSLSFGIFMREMINHFDKKKDVHQVFLTAGLLESIPLFVSPFVCYLVDYFGCRRTALVGSTLLFSSFILARFLVNNLFTLNIVIGLIKGCGLAMIYIPSYLIIPFYYDKRRAFVTGITVSGSGLGLFILSPLSEYLIYEYGWQNAWLLIGAISSHTFASALTYRKTNKTNSERSDFRNFFSKVFLVFLNKRYLMVVASYFLLSAAVIAPHMFLPSHMNLRSELDDPKSISISLLGISNIVGQILIGFIADMYRKQNWLIFVICMMIAGALTCFIPFVSNIFVIYFCSVMFGLVKSVDYVLQSTLLIESGLGVVIFAFSFYYNNKKSRVVWFTFVKCK